MAARLSSVDWKPLSRLSWAALFPVLVALIIEALALEPAELLHFRQPIRAALSLVSLNALPFLAVALAAALLAANLRDHAARESIRSRSSIALAVLTVALAWASAFSMRSFSELLLAGDLSISGDRLVLGGATPPVWTVMLNLMLVVALSVAVVTVSERVPFLRWMFGLNTVHHR